MDIVKEWLAGQGFNLSEEVYLQLARFQALVLVGNEKMNLTRIVSPEDFAVKHFVDSLSLLPFLPVEKPDGARFTLLDVGTGAGFPGGPLRMVRGDMGLTLLDGTRKRLDFLRGALLELGVLGEIIHARAEDMPRLMPARRFDVVTARAVARLDKLVGYALPLVAPGGCLLAMKGPDVVQELADARAVIKKHRAEVEAVTRVQLTDDMTHTVICIRKKEHDL